MSLANTAAGEQKNGGVEGKCGSIKYLVVARSKDQVVVASHVPEGSCTTEEEHRSSVQAVLEAPDFVYKIKPGFRYRIEVAESGEACNLTVSDQHVVFVAITTVAYPEQKAFQLTAAVIRKIKEAVGDRIMTCEKDSLSTELKPVFAELVKEFDDIVNKTDSLLLAVEEVKQVASMTANTLDQNTTTVNTIEEKASDIREQANLFDKKARDIKRQEQRKKLQMLCCGGLTFVIIIVVIIALLS